MNARALRSPLYLPLALAGRVAILAGILAAGGSAPASAADRLVNMIPQGRSGEQNQDAEPTLAIDPNDYARMAGSAFTWDNLTQSPMSTAFAPIYVSSDHGATWTMAFIVPSQVGAPFPTGDINLTFGSTSSGAPLHKTSWLYGGTLSSAIAGYPMTVLRTQDFLDIATPMALLDTQTGNVDQPHAKALSALAGSDTGLDKLYVGFNDGYSCQAPNGRSSTIDVTQDGAAGSPTFAQDVIEARDTACQDGFAQVPAPHLDGTVYAAFIHDFTGSPRVVVVRDDNWGLSPSPFTALLDSNDQIAGSFVTPAITIQSGTMGQQRLGASNLSIAVDPRDSDRVYVTWGTRNGANSETIHVSRSITRGETWSADLLTVTNAMNPQIAINALGTVGVLYQRLVSGRWETHLTRTTDADATVFDNPGVLLANVDATQPANTIASHVYLGDYASLVSAGKNFFGMFSTSNYPDTSTFLSGVQFQRHVDWATHKLYADAAHTMEVPISIDPYFFEVDAAGADLDFYVRDWTTDATHADNGVEPSTYPYFYTSSDVWNRRQPMPGPFVDDAPTNEDAGNGAANIGDNWAFARVWRKAGGAPTAVTAHFLVSKFGTGSNYVDASSGDPDVSFPDPDPVILSDAGTGPWISDAYHWHLADVAGNHLCLAVEISAPGNPYIPPSLEGDTPGWPTTDLRVINDNHKAQRNMHLSTTPGGGVSGMIKDYAIVHNGSLEARDVPLRVAVSGHSARYLRSATLRDLTPGSREEPAGSGQTLLVRGLEPGENRWVEIAVEAAGLPEGATAYVTADDVAGSVTVNGFGVGLRGAPLATAISDSLALYRSTGERLAAGFGASASAADAKVKVEPTEKAYLSFVHDRLVPHLAKDLDQIGVLGGSDPFGLRAALDAAAAGTTAPELVGDVAALLNGVDAQLTQLQLENGDPADIVQMVRWQRRLFRQVPELARLDCAPKLIEASTEFLNGRESRKLTNWDYPQHLEEVSECLREAAGDQGGLKGSDLGKLEKAHRAYLLALAAR